MVKMSEPKKLKMSESDFEGLFCDILGVTQKEWLEIEVLSRHLQSLGLFKKDPMKIYIAAFIYWFESKGFLAEFWQCDIERV